MKTIKMPSNYTAIEHPEQNCICGGSGLLSGSIYAAAKFIFPDEKVAGESRGGYYPTFILVPEAVFLDYAALRVANCLFRAARYIDEMGL